MTTIYEVDGGPSTPSDSKEPLHRYHDDIQQQIDTPLIGLVGDGDAIGRVVVSEALSDQAKSDLESFIGSSLSQTEQS